MGLIRSVRARLRYRWPYRSDATPIVVGGCGRSGTTLVQRILDGHSQVCCGPESNLFLGAILPGHTEAVERLARDFGLPADRVRGFLRASPAHARFIERLFAAYCEARGKPRWAEKTPANVRRVGWVFCHFPGARFVHVVRDGRDVACSIRDYLKTRSPDGRQVASPIDAPLDRIAAYWAGEVRRGLAFRDDPRYVELRYEELARAPRPTLQGLCAALGIGFEDGLVRDEIQPHSVDRWRRELTDDQVATIERVAGETLSQLG